MIKKIIGKKNFGPKKIWLKKNFGTKKKKTIGQKKFGPTKNFDLKKNFGPKNILVRSFIRMTKLKLNQIQDLYIKNWKKKLTSSRSYLKIEIMRLFPYKMVRKQLLRLQEN